MSINVLGEHDIIKMGISMSEQLPETKLSPQVLHLNQPDFNLSYGYEEIVSRRGYALPPINEITLNQTTFKCNPLIMAWVCSKTNGKGKTIETPVAPHFTHPDVIEIYYNSTGKLKSKILTYKVNDKTYSDVVPGDACHKGKYSDYITGVSRLPGCSKGLFNEFWEFLIRTSPNVRMFRLYGHQGWNLNEDSTATFNSAPIRGHIPLDLFPVSVLRRKTQSMFNDASEVISNWLGLYAKHPVLKFISYFRIGSLLQFFLNGEGVSIRQIAFVESSKDVSVDKLKNMLATNNIKDYPIPRLEYDTETVLKELNYVYDGVALFIDSSFADEEAKICTNVKALIKAVRRDLEDTEPSRYMIAAISDNAAYIASRLAPENVIVLSSDGITLSETAEQIESITDKMDSLIISAISNHFDAAKNFIASKAAEFRDKLSKYKNDESLDTLIMLFVVDDFIKHFLGVSLLDNEDMIQLLPSIDDKDNHKMSADQAILNNFAGVLSSKLRSGELRIVRKKKNMLFNSDGFVILNGERLYIGEKTLDTILAEMKSTHNKDSMLKTLKRTASLNYKDGYAHRIELHDTNGQHKRLYMYDISTEILDFDVLYMLNNLESEAFLLREGDTPKSDFITLINGVNGTIAGKRLRYKDEENNHFYITGQSGSGKTYLLCQLIAKCFSLNHQVVVFDSSDSFRYETMCRNLSKRFVDENIIFHNLDRDGIPVDLFRIDRNVSLPSQKKQLIDVLTAGIGELSVPQSNTLRSALSDMLSTLNKDERVQTYNILSMLGEEGTTYESLRNRFEPLFEDIDECGMKTSSWEDFFRQSGKIVILHTDSTFTENGNQIIDMLLSTLFSYQRENFITPLDVFIDELQNQNFSKISPIRKILKEGRKFHLSFFGATQDYYSRSTELGSAMSKADTQIFLRPTPNSESIVASELRFHKADMARFDAMQRGDCIVKGSLYSKEQDRNIPTILSGSVNDYPKMSDNYYGNAR